MQQLSLFGDNEGRPPARPPDRERDVIFYALLLGPQLWAPLARLVTAQREAHGLTGRMKATDTFHVSVLGLGFADTLHDSEIELGRSIAEAVKFEPFDLVFSELLSWSGKKKQGAPCPLVLTCAAGDIDVLRLAARLAASMIAHGFRPRSFAPRTPHLTLLYDTIRVPKRVLEPPISVRLEGFSLVHSHRGQGRYTVLWPEP